MTQATQLPEQVAYADILAFVTDQLIPGTTYTQREVVEGRRAGLLASAQTVTRHIETINHERTEESARTWIETMRTHVGNLGSISSREIGLRDPNEPGTATAEQLATELYNLSRSPQGFQETRLQNQELQFLFPRLQLTDPARNNAQVLVGNFWLVLTRTGGLRCVVDESRTLHNPAGTSYHPHVQCQSGEICMGDQRDAWTRLRQNRMFVDAILFTKDGLATYNSGNPYVSLSSWAAHNMGILSRCHACRGYVRRSTNCSECEHALCDACGKRCRGCRRIYCSSHETDFAEGLCADCRVSCSRCGDTVLRDESVTCWHCRDTVCENCSGLVRCWDGSHWFCIRGDGEETCFGECVVCQRTCAASEMFGAHCLRCAVDVYPPSDRRMILAELPAQAARVTPLRLRFAHSIALASAET